MAEKVGYRRLSPRRRCAAWFVREGRGLAVSAFWLAAWWRQARRDVRLRTCQRCLVRFDDRDTLVRHHFMVHRRAR